MSHLIQLRNRIKAIKTIKKITHAMRLISMSSHSQLRKHQDTLKDYQQHVRTLFNHAVAKNPSWQHPFIQTITDQEPRTLILLIGGQKGLCGNFNSALCSFAQNYLENEIDSAFDLLVVGKKTVDFVQNTYKDQTIKTFDYFTTHNYLQLAQEIITIIEQNITTYTSIRIISNQSESFFVRNPQATILTPLAIEQHAISGVQYYWEQPAHDVLDYLVQEYVFATIQQTLFESLLSEHASRFISMDGATRNADTMLEKAQLTYNKLRQAKITRELTELVGSYL